MNFIPNNRLSFNSIQFNINTNFRIDLVALLILGIISIVAIALFYNSNGQIMIYYDSYKHYQSAIFLSEGLTTDNNPFIIFLSFLYSIFPAENALTLIRFFMILFSIQLVFFFYLTIRKIIDPLFSFAGAAMLSFIPVFMTYSITLHDDIFAFAMGLSALYFSIKPKNSFKMIISIILIIFTGLTRIDVFMVFIIPVLIGFSYYLSKKTKMNFHKIVALTLMTFLIPAYFVVQISDKFYYDDWFEHNILAQLIAFLTWDTIKMIIQSAFEVTSESSADILGLEKFNILYFTVFIFGMIIFLMKNYKIIINPKNLLKIQFNKKEYTVIYLIIISIVSIITLGAFHLSFTPLENDDIQISEEILPRYMIGLRIFVLVGFIYGLKQISNIIIGFFKVSKNKELSIKQKKYSNCKKISNVFSFILHKNSTKIELKNYELVSFVIVSFMIIIFLEPMWITAEQFYENKSITLEKYYESAYWLSNNLNENERVFLPMENTFWSFEPSLRSKTYSYLDNFYFDNGTRIFIRPQITDNEKNIIIHNFHNFISDPSNNVKFVVVDWVDRGAKYSVDFSNKDLRNRDDSCNKIIPTAKNVKKFSFDLPHSNWGSAIVICEIKN